MPKLVRSYRISEQVDALLKTEAANLTETEGEKVSEADVIELAVTAWCAGVGRNTEPTPQPTAAASITADAPPPKRAESVAQRKAREAKEHAEKLAECDVTARMTGRDDIEYDLENVPRQSAFHVALQKPAPEKHHYKVEKREAKPLTRPHGSTEAKRRREQ